MNGQLKISCCYCCCCCCSRWCCCCCCCCCCCWMSVAFLVFLGEVLARSAQFLRCAFRSPARPRSTRPPFSNLAGKNKSELKRGYTPPPLFLKRGSPGDPKDPSRIPKDPSWTSKGLFFLLIWNEQVHKIEKGNPKECLYYLNVQTTNLSLNIYSINLDSCSTLVMFR